MQLRWIGTRAPRDRTGPSLPEHFDVIVVGTGPAGSAFLRTLRDEAPDTRVAVLDKAVFPRDKVCGDALTHTSCPLVQEIFPELRGKIPTRSFTHRYTLRYPSGHVFSREDQELDVIPRRELDDLLWTAARHDGAVVLEGARVSDVLTDGIRVTGVIAKHQGEVLELSGDLVIAADGSNSMIMRRTRTARADTPPIAVRQYVRGIPPTGDGLIFVIDPDHHGYFWLFPIVENDRWSANVGWFGFGGRGVNPRARLESFLSDEDIVRRYLGSGQRIGSVKAFPLNLAPTRSGRLRAGRPLWGPGYLLLGDSAGLIHPFTGEGIAFALHSGRRAAELVGESTDTAVIGPRYQEDGLAFVDGVYSMTRTAMLFYLPCALPKPVRSLYLTALPGLDATRKAVKRAKGFARGAVQRRR